MLVVHHCEEPSAQICTGLKEVALGQRPTEAVLDEVISRRSVTTKRVRIATQSRDLFFQHSGEILQGIHSHKLPSDEDANAELAGLGMYGR
jgi:hypothetical protein